MHMHMHTHTHTHSTSNTRTHWHMYTHNMHLSGGASGEPAAAAASDVWDVIWAAAFGGSLARFGSLPSQRLSRCALFPAQGWWGMCARTLLLSFFSPFCIAMCVCYGWLMAWGSVRCVYAMGKEKAMCLFDYIDVRWCLSSYGRLLHSIHGCDGTPFSFIYFYF